MFDEKRREISTGAFSFSRQTFVRRRQNRTSIKRSKIHWTIEFDLPQGQLTTTKHDIAASTSLKAVVVDLLDNLTTPQKEQVAALIQAPIGDICVLMKVNYRGHFIYHPWFHMKSQPRCH